MSDFRLAVNQSAPRLGAAAENAEQLRGIVAEAGANLVLTSELSLTGYDLRDRVHDLAVTPDTVASQLALSGQQALTVGFVEHGETGVPYNAALVLRGGAIVHHHRKIHLPTYGMFDEGRYFGRGTQVDSFDLDGWRLGLLICEDFWHPSLIYLLACQRIDVLLVMAAAPGRGAWDGGEHGPFASADVWERIARTYAQLYGIYVALSNRAGIEGGVTFAAGSLVVAPTGEVVARAATIDQELLLVDLQRSELERARRPYAHIRDEDPSFVLRELQRAALPT
jgi:predicted amidohydrolase